MAKNSHIPSFTPGPLQRVESFDGDLAALGRNDLLAIAISHKDPDREAARYELARRAWNRQVQKARA